MDNNIGLRIKKIRTAKKLTQGEFSKIIGIKQTDLSHIENKSLEISIDILSKIIYNFDIDANWLLSGKEKTQRNEHKIGDISNSTVVGANVSGNGISIHHPISEETIAEFSKNYSEIIKKQSEQIDNLIITINGLQKQIDNLIAVANKLSDKAT
ncbi:MAG: helix-turn-helix domain-containing protein [Chitinophagaceae bacterium]|jgi:transcriptional regulator with XRE-family HTH domain|nr:helix-turn-helix domain-containing protein [Chitinophagaceae bacterium]